jgi:hypothetical protein
MKRTATAIQAKSALAGDELYQRRGRQALPILVRQARAGETIMYSDLAEELQMPNPRNLNFVLGAAGQAVDDYAERQGIRVPRLTALVVNKATGLPGEGVVDFLDRPEEFRAAPLPVRKRLLDRILFEIFTFAGWERMLREMGLQPLPSLLTAPRPVGGTGGEGEAHRQLKEFIAAHPESIGLSRRSAPGKIEALLSSGDEVDVIFAADGNQIGIEVKAHDASESEIERGLYQCIKYSAVLQAMQKAAQATPAAEVWLALGGSLPKRLIALRNTLGVVVLEKVAHGRFVPTAGG